jgi:hypothetical protein
VLEGENEGMKEGININGNKTDEKTKSERNAKGCPKFPGKSIDFYFNKGGSDA